MKENSIKLEDIEILLNQQLQDLYCLEMVSKDVLPKFKNASSDEALKTTIDAQCITLNANLKHILKLAEEANIKLSNDTCSTLENIVLKSESYLDKGPVNDFGILSHIDRINQYKTAVYNSAVRFAKALNYKKFYKELENIKNYTYNMNDRLARLVDNKSDERLIENL
tara:strand:+ start:7581 stop:8084 length:504 start_codon:yes stop_codon:yes gene_type:complete